MIIENIYEKENPLIFKIGNKKIDLTILNENISCFQLNRDENNQIFFDVIFNEYDDFNDDSFNCYRKLAVLSGDDDLLKFIRNDFKIDNQKIKQDFCKTWELACDNIMLEGNGESIIINDLDINLTIEKEAFIELCGYIDNAIDINYGLNKLSEAFKEAKQEYLNQQVISKEIDKNQTIQSIKSKKIHN